MSYTYTSGYFCSSLSIGLSHFGYVCTLFITFFISLGEIFHHQHSGKTIKWYRIFIGPWITLFYATRKFTLKSNKESGSFYPFSRVLVMKIFPQWDNKYVNKAKVWKPYIISKSRFYFRCCESFFLLFALRSVKILIIFNWISRDDDSRIGLNFI